MPFISFLISNLGHRNTPPAITYHLCSYEVLTGEQSYTVYEFQQNTTQEGYERELLAFCQESRGEKVTNAEPSEPFEEWAYDDRIYRNPFVRNLTEEEYNVLRQYL